MHVRKYAHSPFAPGRSAAHSSLRPGSVLNLALALLFIIAAGFGFTPTARADMRILEVDEQSSAVIVARYQEYLEYLRIADPDAEISVFDFEQIDLAELRTFEGSDVWSPESLQYSLALNVRDPEGFATQHDVTIDAIWREREVRPEDLAPGLSIVEMIESELKSQGSAKSVSSIHQFNVRATVTGRTVEYPSIAVWVRSSREAALGLRIVDIVLPFVNVIDVAAEEFASRTEAVELRWSSQDLKAGGLARVCRSSMEHYFYPEIEIFGGTTSKVPPSGWFSSGVETVISDELDGAYAGKKAIKRFESHEQHPGEGHGFFFRTELTCECQENCQNIATMRSIAIGHGVEPRGMNPTFGRHTLSRSVGTTTQYMDATDGVTWAHGGAAVKIKPCVSVIACEATSDFTVSVSLGGELGGGPFTGSFNVNASGDESYLAGYASAACPACKRLLFVEGDVTGLPEGATAEVFARYQVTETIFREDRIGTVSADRTHFASDSVIPAAPLGEAWDITVEARPSNSSIECTPYQNSFRDENLSGVLINCIANSETYEVKANLTVERLDSQSTADFNVQAFLAEHRIPPDPRTLMATWDNEQGLRTLSDEIRRGSDFEAYIVASTSGGDPRRPELIECEWDPLEGISVVGPVSIEIECDIESFSEFDLCEERPELCADEGNPNCYDVTEYLYEVRIRTTIYEGGYRPPDHEVISVTEIKTETYKQCTLDTPPSTWNSFHEKSSSGGPIAYLRNEPDRRYRSNDWLVVEGVARDGGASRTPRVLVDGQLVALTAFETGLYDPDTCTEVPTAGCNPHSGFRGAMNLVGLALGRHTVEVALRRSDGSFVVIHEQAFWVDPADTASVGADLVFTRLPTEMSCGEERRSTVILRNTGTETWDETFVLAAAGDNDPFRNTSRVQILPADVTVAPGETHAFNFFQKAPNVGGTYRTEWQMLEVGVGRFGDIAARDVQVTCPAAPFDDAESHENDLPSSMECGTTESVTLTMLNNGNTTWSEAEEIRLGAVGEEDPFTSTLRHSLGTSIAPTQVYPFQLQLTAPSQPGTYRTDWQMVRDETGDRFGTVVASDIQVFCPASSDTITLNPVADGSVFEANPTVTLPGDPTLYVESDAEGEAKHTLLRFSLPSISGNILAAKLRIRTRSFVPELAVFEVRNLNWSEATLNWNNHMPASPQDFHYLRSGLGLWAEAWHEIDVSDAVTCCGSIDLGLVSGYTIDQRLYGRSSIHQPKLVITYQPN